MPPLGRYGQSIAELLMRQGENQARGAQRMGAIVGGTIANVGGQIENTMYQRGVEKDQAQREAQFNEAITTWDGKDPMALYRSVAVAGGPELGLKTMQAAVALRKAQADMAATGKVEVGDALAVAKAVAAQEEASPGWLERSWETAYPILAPIGQASGLPVPEQYSPEFKDRLMAAAYSDVKPEGNKVMSPSSSLISPEGDVIATAPAAPEKPRVPIDVLEAEAAAKARGTESVAGPRRQAEAAKAARKGETALRKEYTKQTKAAVTGIQAIDRFSLKPFEKMRRGETLTPEDQFAMIYAFNKALDPTSVVREGEFRNTRQVGLGVHEQALLMLNRWREGAQLTQDQVKGMMEVIQGTKQTLRQQIMDQDRFFTDLAVQSGFNAENVVGGTAGYSGEAPAAAPESGPGAVLHFDAQGNLIQPGE